MAAMRVPAARRYDVRLILELPANNPCAGALCASVSTRCWWLLVPVCARRQRVGIGEGDLGQDPLAGQRGAWLAGDVGGELSPGGEGGFLLPASASS
jgi:hypothetical protein